MRRIHKCGKCGRYSMNEICRCGSQTSMAKPLKYSPDDRLAGYRRKAKHAEYLERYLL